MRLDKDFVNNALVNFQMINGETLPGSSFSVDTRTLQKGDIFVALQGAQSDGHTFIGEALAKQASGLIVAREKRAEIESLYASALKDVQILYVENPKEALIDLAKEWRKQFTYPVLGITGSVGKTSTKEMIANIFRASSEKFFVSYGNQNTLIGVALNIFKMQADCKAAVFEVGISTRGSMTEIVDLLRPTYGIITAIGHAHMEGLGSLSDVAAEKRNIFHYFAPENIGIINGDQDVLSRIAYAHPVVKFGLKTTNQIQARKISIQNNTISFIAKIYNKKYPVVLQGCHEGRILNALAAISFAYLLNIPAEIAIKGVQKDLAVSGRFELCTTDNDSVLINDCYNANPESMKAGLLAFNAYETELDKIIILGDMLELGVDAAFWHRQVGRFLRKVSNVKNIILIGNMVQWIKKTAPLGMSVELYGNWKEALPRIHEITKQPHVVFIKASNGVGLKNIIESFSMK